MLPMLNLSKAVGIRRYLFTMSRSLISSCLTLLILTRTDEHLAHLTAEPISALSAPNQGLADIEHIVSHATTYLCAGGLLAIEHGHDQGDAVRQLFLDNGFESVHTVQDFGGNDRVTLGQDAVAGFVLYEVF